MATEITNFNQPQPDEQPRPQWPFSKIFAAPINHPAKIAIATTKLAIALQSELDPLVLAEWQQTLESYSDDELCRAFERARRQIAAFPTASQVAEFIEKSRFRDALAIVLRGLPKHGVDWQSIRGMREATDRRVPIDLNNPETFKVTQWPVEAPELPRRIIRALEIFGGDGTMRAGLVRLKRDHPNLWNGDTEYTTGQHGRQASGIERDMWDAWKEADGE